MIFPIILVLAMMFLILSVCLYLHYRGKVKDHGYVPGEKFGKNDLREKRGLWSGWIIATPILTLAVFAFGSLGVASGSPNTSTLNYADNVREVGVERFIPIGTGDEAKYVFILDNGEAITVKDRDLDILESSEGPGKVRYGHAYESWGYWLPFNDWLTDDYQVEYTPGN